MGEQAYGIDTDMVRVSAMRLKALLTKVQVSLVIGGGNIFRGVSGGRRHGAGDG